MDHRGNSSVHSLETNQIQRVPSQFKLKKVHRHVYDPVIVSLGPYHHGIPDCRHAELFKQVSLDTFVSQSHHNTDKSFYHAKIMERIRDIRVCYEEVEYDDDSLAWMILRDACFIIHLMEMNLEITSLWENKPPFYNHFGEGRLTFIFRDLYLLENQIPFWIMKCLLRWRLVDGGESEWNEMFCRFMSFLIFGGVGSLETLPWIDEGYEPVHFLDALRYFQLVPVKSFRKHRQKVRKVYEIESHQFRSITSLKGKGIRFKLSDQFNFTSHTFYGQLQLPPLILSRNFFVMYSNIIAYEMSPTSDTDLSATSFLNFIKSLIESSNDVKILREGQILFNCVGSDDEVVKLLRDLDTFNMVNADIFARLKNDIKRHCSSKSKTWMAELIHTYFVSPWSTIALLGTFCLLCLTFLQTFFTIHPRL